MGFAADVSRLVEAAKGRQDVVIHKILMGIGRSVTMRSPVGNPELWNSLGGYVSLVTPTGRMKKNPSGGKVQFTRKPPAGYTGGHFRGNWQYGFGARPTAELPNIDENGALTVERLAAEIQASPAIGIHFIANNLPYGEALENGWSSQSPPGGMVTLTVMEFEQIVRGAQL